MRQYFANQRLQEEGKFVFQRLQEEGTFVNQRLQEEGKFANMHKGKADDYVRFGTNYMDTNELGEVEHQPD